jgi:hypothetical protein
MKTCDVHTLLGYRTNANVSFLHGYRSGQAFMETLLTDSRCRCDDPVIVIDFDNRYEVTAGYMLGAFVEPAAARIAQKGQVQRFLLKRVKESACLELEMAIAYYLQKKSVKLEHLVIPVIKEDGLQLLGHLEKSLQKVWEYACGLEEVTPGMVQAQFQVSDTDASTRLKELYHLGLFLRFKHGKKYVYRPVHVDSSANQPEVVKPSASPAPAEGKPTVLLTYVNGKAQFTKMSGVSKYFS